MTVGSHGVRRKTDSSFPHFKLTKEDIGKILLVCYDLRDKLIIILLLETGMRGSDLIRMKWSNLNLSKKTYFYISKKTHTPVYIPLSQELIALLKTYQLRHEALYDSSEDRLFPISIQRMREKVKEITNRAKLGRKVFLHDFCVTAISHLLINQIPLAMVCAITGRTPATILGYYSKYSINEMRSELAGKSLVQTLVKE